MPFKKQPAVESEFEDIDNSSMYTSDDDDYDEINSS